MNEHIKSISKRPLKNHIDDINLFIEDLKLAEATPYITMKILSTKLKIDFSESKKFVFDAPSWEGLAMQADILLGLFLGDDPEETE